MLRIHRIAVVMFASLVASMLATTPATAQFRKTRIPYKVGDRVMVERFGEWRPGRVVEIINDQGWAQVDTADRFSGVYTNDSIRLVKKKPKSSGEPATDPFATPDERAANEKPRKWSDASGKFNVEATLVRVEGTGVVLRRADGKEITVPRTRLCRADQEYIAAFAGEDSSGAASTDNGLEDEFGNDFDDPTRARIEEALDSDIRDAPEFELKPVELDQAVQVDLSPTDQWTFQPDAEATEAPLQLRVQLGAIPRSSHPQRLFLVPVRSRAFVLFEDPFPKDGESKHDVVICDWAKRKVERRVKFHRGQVPLDISEDGTRLAATVDDFFGGGKETLYVYRINELAATPQMAFQPFGGPERFSHNKIKWATWVNSDRLLTGSELSGKVALWDLSESPKPVYVMHSEFVFSVPALSPTRRYLATRVENGVVLLEALSGERVGFLRTPDPGSPFGRLAWRKDGKRLVLAEGSRLRVWDLDTRTIVRDFTFATDNTACGYLTWVDDRRVLINGHLVVDLELQVPIWSYPSRGYPVVTHAGTAWTVAEGSGGDGYSLMAVRIPNDEARALAAKYKPEDLEIIRPGMEVALDVQIPGPPERQARVMEVLTEKLQDAQMTVTSSARLKLVARIQPGRQIEIEYRSFGSFQTTKHQVKSETLTLTYTLDGKEVWSHVSETMPPHMLHLQQGESVDQALSRSMRQDPAYFGSIFVPSRVSRLPGAAGPAGNTPPATPGPRPGQRDA